MSVKVDPQAIRSVQVITPRLQKLKAEWEAAEPQVYVDDTLLFTESWKETEGLPVDIRWAKALEKRLMECPLLLRDGELLAGALPRKQLKIVAGWLAYHEEEAYRAWNLAVRGEHFDKIPPMN